MHCCHGGPVKRKYLRPWRTRVIYRKVVHRVNRSSGGQRPSVLLDCEVSRWDLEFTPEFRRVPTEATFTGRDVDCMACIAAAAVP